MYSRRAAEKALATVRALHLSLTPADDSAADSTRPTSRPRLVKQLPPTTDDGYLYDLFRPFGAIARAQCILTNPAGHHTGFRGMANVEFYAEEDAQRAQDEMHCVEIEGKTISVSVDNVARRPSGATAAATATRGASTSSSLSSSSSDISPHSAPFVPRLSAQAPAFAPPTASSTSIHAAPPSSNLQYSSAASTYIDPCNLFCKNLCPSLSSGDLFAIFKPFGRIVSARVMRDEQGTSREFGFVSFTTAEDAARALHAVNGQVIGSKTIMVRLHEPKKMRQEKLSRRFGGGGGGGEGGGATSGTPSAINSPDGDGALTATEAKDYLAVNASGNAKNGSGVPSSPSTTSSTTLFSEAHLASLPQDVRSEVLNAELTRRVRGLQGEGDHAGVKDTVQALLGLSLAEQVRVLNDAGELQVRVGGGGGRRADDYDGGNTDKTGEATASAATPAALDTSLPERTRLYKAVEAVLANDSTTATSMAEDITDMLAGLGKKDRANMLFNRVFLKGKVDEAREILESTSDGGGEGGEGKAGGEAATNGKDGASVDGKGGQAASATASPPHTLASLAQLSCAEIVALATSPSSSPSPLLKVDPSTWSGTDAMMDRILAEPKEAERKQKLGDVLFKRIRSFGIKGAPKVTIALLDSEDLRALAHVMESFPDVLREKVVAGAAVKK